MPDEILVEFKPGTADHSISSAINALGGSIITYRHQAVSPIQWSLNKSDQKSFLGHPSLFHIKVPPSIGAEGAIDQLLNNPTVNFAEYNYCFHAALAVEDFFSLQWALDNTASNSGGSIDADIDAPEAWNICIGSQNVVVAVIDTGIQYDHPDLQANIWTNTDEIAGNNQDDDGNGYFDDVRGWNFSTTPGNNNVADDHPDSHGTHIAGIIGAVGADNNGISGVCWNVKLMPIKNMTSSGNATISSCISAIDYAIANGAKIINISWRIPTNSSALYQAIECAQTNGVIVVVAAGNWSLGDEFEIPPDDDIGGEGGGGIPPESGANLDITPRWPVSFDLDNIISVLATDCSDNKTWYSYYGQYTVDLGAPGGTAVSDTDQKGSIWSTARNSSYRYSRGTSMAAPFVSGVAALLLGQRPSLDWWQIKTIIMKSVDNISSLVGFCRTHGRLNAYNAVSFPTPILPLAPSSLTGTAFENGDFYDIRLIWADNSNNEDGFKIYIKTNNTYEELDTVGPNCTSYWLTDALPGNYCFYVRASATDGESPKTNMVSVYAH